MDLVGLMLGFVAGLCLYLIVADLCLGFVFQHLRKFHLFQFESFTEQIEY